MASSKTLIAGVLGGIALGTAYALSPLGVWFAAAVAGIFIWAGRGLGESERRWIFGILAAAIALRVLAIALLFALQPHDVAVSFFWDGDGVYLKQRAIWISNVWSGVPIAPVDFANAFSREYGWTTYLYVLAYLQYLTGPMPYAVHLFNATIFVATAVALYRLARPVYGPHAAMLGLFVLLFLPSPFLWSVSALKESLYVFIAVLALVGLVTAWRAGSVAKRAAAFAIMLMALAVIGSVRAGGLVIVGVGLLLGLLASIVTRRAWLTVTVLVLVLAGATYALRRADVQARVVSRLTQSAVLHLGNVRTAGHSYRLLDGLSYFSPAEGFTMSPPEAARFVVRAVASLLAVPLPWQIDTPSERLFLPQQVLWYLLVAFACVGLVAGLRRDPLVTCLLAAFAVTGGLVIALNSGNIGTMVRHRDTIVPFVVWLSALGATSTLSKLAARNEV
jgi:hypothetical protein